MKRRRNFVSVLGVSMLAALSLTAILASSAQAAGNGLFLINLLNIATFPQNVKGSTTADGELLSIGLNIFCANGTGTAATFTGSLISATHGKGTAVFHSCTILGGEAVCLIEPIGALGGLITTKPLLAELLLLGKIVRFKPLTGNILALVAILSHGGECTVIVDQHLEVINVEGSACAEVVADTVKLILKSPHCSLSVGGNAAEIHGQPILVETAGGLKVNTHA